MSKFKVGDKVRFTDHYLHKNYPDRFPEVGTTGIIRSFAEWPIVEWPFGSIYGNDVQQCPYIHLELVETEPDIEQLGEEYLALKCEFDRMRKNIADALRDLAERIGTNT